MAVRTCSEVLREEMHILGKSGRWIEKAIQWVLIAIIVDVLVARRDAHEVRLPDDAGLKLLEQ